MLKKILFYCALIFSVTVFCFIFLCDSATMKKEPVESFLARLKPVLCLSMKTHLEIEIGEDEIKTFGDGLEYGDGEDRLFLKIRESGIKYKLRNGYDCRIYPLDVAGYKNKSLYLTAKREWLVVWPAIEGYLDAVTVVRSSKWFKNLPSDSINGTDVYLGTLEERNKGRDKYYHPFVNFILIDVTALYPDEAYQEEEIHLAFEKEDLEKVNSGDRVVLYTQDNPIRNYVRHVKQWILFDDIKKKK